MRSKISEVPYPKVTINPAAKILERIHSRFCRVYPLISRDEIGSAFGSFKLFVEKQTRKTIRCVRKDNAKEYI